MVHQPSSAADGQFEVAVAEVAGAADVAVVNVEY